MSSLVRTVLAHGLAACSLCVTPHPLPCISLPFRYFHPLKNSINTFVIHLPHLTNFQGDLYSERANRVAGTLVDPHSPKIKYCVACCRWWLHALDSPLRVWGCMEPHSPGGTFWEHRKKQKRKRKQRRKWGKRAKAGLTMMLS